MDLSNFRLIRLEHNYAIKDFDCDDSDLNEFLLVDSCPQLMQLFSVTYLLEENETDKTVAFFTLVNDKIKVEDSSSKNFWNRKVGQNIPHNKRRKDYPAVKIGRLGVHKEYKGRKIGTLILDYIKVWFVEKNKTGCRFVTVDAYSQSLPFYEKNGFEYLTKKDDKEAKKGKKSKHGTRLMYFDLKRIA